MTAGRMPRGGRRRNGAVPVVMLGMALATAALAGGCSSGGSRVSSAPATVPPSSSTVVTAPPTSLSGSGPVPTVFDCGGGAYEPATLLVTCGDAATSAVTTVTAVHWSQWTATGASGNGTVSLRVAGHAVQAPAALSLGRVVQTENGAQYSSLKVTWTGPSPDGHASDDFALATAPR